jgi:adenylate cyclase
MNEPIPAELASAGLLDGLEGEARAQREGLLGDLLEAGVPPADLVRAHEEGTLVFLLAERAIGGSERLTRAQAAERAGISPTLLAELVRAQGIAIAPEEEAIYAAPDIEAASVAAKAIALGITEEEILLVTRVLGRGLSHSAETMRSIVLRMVLEPGLGEREVARRYAEVSEHLGPMLGPLVTSLLNIHLRHMAQSEAMRITEHVTGRLPGARDMHVGFADLVGFTRVGEEVDPEELGRVAGRLEDIALEVTAGAASSVSLVKTIGDAVMLISPDGPAMVEAALALVEGADAEGESFPQLRAGVASGPTVARGGDWFGRPVNLASRVAAVARPGSLLVTAPVRESARDAAFAWSFAGERRVKGVREPVRLYRARRAEAAA